MPARQELGCGGDGGREGEDVEPGQARRPEDPGNGERRDREERDEKHQTLAGAAAGSSGRRPTAGSDRVVGYAAIGPSDSHLPRLAAEILHRDAVEPV